MVRNEEDFSQENIPQNTWMQFKKIGDQIKGTFTEKNIKVGQGDFKDQMVYQLVNAEAIIDGKKQESKEYNVGISSKYVNDRFKNVVPGQRIGLKFDKEVKSKVKSWAPAKSLLPNVWSIDPEYKGKETFKNDIDFE